MSAESEKWRQRCVARKRALASRLQRTENLTASQAMAVAHEIIGQPYSVWPDLLNYLIAKARKAGPEILHSLYDYP